MAVYVDDFGCPANVGGLNARWSHLIADTVDELHAFAARLGLRRDWFQDPVVNGKPKAAPGTRAAENWHYDVTQSKRRLAIRMGAVPVAYRDLPKIIEARYDAQQPATTSKETAR
jgi:hypothetical protein